MTTPTLQSNFRSPANEMLRIRQATAHAPRLEGANKQYGTNIIVSESTWNKVRHQLRGRELDVIRVKGKEKPCRIIELLGDETRNESE